VKQLAYFCDRLANTKDGGDGSLLDNSMTLYGAALSDANLHLYTDLPLLLTAGKKHRYQGRRDRQVSEAHSDDQPARDHAGQGWRDGRGSLGDSKAVLALPSFS